jgi:peptidoglycan hydrolase-like protein with peptidoglycan-binding domain
VTESELKQPGTTAPAPAPATTTRTPSTSSRSDPAVRELQTRLRADGYNPGTVDGVWGPNPSTALQRAVSAMGIAAANARYGAAMVSLLGEGALEAADGVASTGGGPSFEEQGGMFDGIARWITGFLGGGDNQPAGGAAEAATGLVDAAAGAATDLARRQAAAAAQRRITEVVSSPAFLIGAGVLGVGVVMMLLPSKSDKRAKRAKRQAAAAKA